MGDLRKSRSGSLAPSRKPRSETAMENRPKRPRRPSDLEDQSTRDTHLAEDPTPLPESPDPSWSSLGQTRILTPTEEQGLTGSDAGRAQSTAKVSELGEYKLLKKLGEGAMGAVFLARQPSFEDRLVALKVLFPHIASNQK